MMVLSVDLDTAVMPAATPKMSGEWKNGEWFDQRPSAELPFTIHH
jgi:hypothetical protein